MNYIEPEDEPEPEEPSEEEIIVLPEESKEPKEVRIIKRTIKPKILKTEIIKVKSAEGAETRFDHNNGFDGGLTIHHIPKYIQLTFSSKAGKYGGFI